MQDDGKDASKMRAKALAVLCAVLPLLYHIQLQKSSRSSSSFNSMKKAVRIIAIAATALGAAFGTIAILRKIMANKEDML